MDYHYHAVKDVRTLPLFTLMEVITEHEAEYLSFQTGR